jgi:hypothetical protein
MALLHRGANISLDSQSHFPNNDFEGADMYSHRIVSTLKGIEEMRPIWEELQSRSGRCLQTDIDYYVAEIESQRGSTCPYVIVLYKSGAPMSALIGSIENDTLEVGLGYMTLFRPKVRSLKISHPEIIGDDSYGACKSILSILKDSFAQFQIDVISFERVRSDSHLYAVASACTYSPIRCCALPWTERWTTLLPESYKVFYSALSRKKKDKIRNVLLRLKKAFANAVTYQCFSQRSELDVALDVLEAISAKAWQRRIGRGFTLNDRTRARYSHASEHGWLRIYVVNINAEPAAFWIGFRYEKTFTLEFTGYDPKFSHYSPGVALLVKIFEDMCSDKDISVIDFGPGPDEYKRYYGTQNCFETSVFLFARSAKGFRLNAIWMARTMMAYIGKILLRYLELETRMKKWWRNRLKGKSP